MAHLLNDPYHKTTTVTPGPPSGEQPGSGSTFGGGSTIGTSKGPRDPGMRKDPPPRLLPSMNTVPGYVNPNLGSSVSNLTKSDTHYLPDPRIVTQPAKPKPIYSPVDRGLHPGRIPSVPFNFYPKPSPYPQARSSYSPPKPSIKPSPGPSPRPAVVPASNRTTTVS